MKRKRKTASQLPKELTDYLETNEKEMIMEITSPSKKRKNIIDSPLEEKEEESTVDITENENNEDELNRLKENLNLFNEMNNENIKDFIGESARLVSIGENPEKYKLIDNEKFTTEDNIVRRIIYKSVDNQNNSSYSSTPFEDIKNIICINFTLQHFKENAAKWYDLKDKYLFLLSSILNSIAYYNGCKNEEIYKVKKVARGRKKSSEQQQPQDEAIEDNTLNNEELLNNNNEENLQQKKNQKKEPIQLYIETLFGNKIENKVMGFRLWILNKKDEDPLSMELMNTINESIEIKKQFDHQKQKTLQSKSGKSLDGDKIKIWKHLCFANYTSFHDYFYSAIKPYFSSDINLIQTPTENNKDENLFTDNRKFMNIKEKIIDDPYIFHKLKTDKNHDCNLGKIFSKESAMIYHSVKYQEDYLNPIQCDLKYYSQLLVSSDNSDESSNEIMIESNNNNNNNSFSNSNTMIKRKHIERLNKMIESNILDSSLTKFCIPSTTYHVSTTEFIISEFLLKMPLPHRIGSILFNNNHLKKYITHINNKEKPNLSKSIDKDELFGLRSNDHLPIGLSNTKVDIDLDEIRSDVKGDAHFLIEYIHELESRPDLIEKYKLTKTDTIKSQLQIISQTKGSKSLKIEIEGSTSHLNNNDNNSNHNEYISSTKCNIEKQDSLNNDSLITQIIEEQKNKLNRSPQENNEIILQKQLASAQISLYTPILSKYGLADTSLESIKAAGIKTIVEETFLTRCVALRENEVNSVSYQAIEKKFYSKKGKIDKNMEKSFHKERRLYLEGSLVRAFNAFFESPDVSTAVMSVREELTTIDNDGKKVYGTQMPKTEYNVDVRPYHHYRIWINKFLSKIADVTYNYKIIACLLFGRYHHCRFYPKSNYPKLNQLLSGVGGTGKSYYLHLVKDVCPGNIGDNLTHVTNQAYHVDENKNDILMIQEEMQSALLGLTNGDGKNNVPESDATNFLKARLTSGEASVMSYRYDEEAKRRTSVISKCHCQGLFYGATNTALIQADVNILTRFINHSVPKSKNNIEGLRVHDKTKPQMAKDILLTQGLYNQHKEIHRVYLMVEFFIKSGVLDNQEYGCSIDGAIFLINGILDHMQLYYGVNTNDPRKRNDVIEMARIMCISHAVWFGLTSPMTAHLFLDPETGKYIGLNPRVFLDGIFPFLVVTKDMVIDALTLLSSLWNHEYSDAILTGISTVFCRLHEVRQSDFKRVATPSNNINGGDSDGKGGYNNSRKKIEEMKNGNNNAQKISEAMHDTETFPFDYNYLSITSTNHQNLHDHIHSLLGNLTISSFDVQKVLNDLKKEDMIESHGYDYIMDKKDGPKLIKSSNEDTFLRRKIVEYDSCPITGRKRISVLVHYLKQKLPSLFPDSKIADLSNHSDEEKKRLDEIHEERNKIEEGFDEDTVEGLINLTRESRLRKLGKVNASNETILIRCIREVLETPALEKTSVNSNLEKETEEEYKNYHTNEIPWYNYVIADNPRSIKIYDYMDDDLISSYRKTKGFNDEILFPDELLTLSLKRRDNSRFFMINNHNTTSPCSDAVLSIFKQDELDTNSSSSTSTSTSNPTNNSITKNRLKECLKNSLWQQDLDMDWIFCNDWLTHICFNNLKNFEHIRSINYPPSTYIALLECYEENERKGKKEFKLRLEYPFCELNAKIEERTNRIRSKTNKNNTEFIKLSNLVTSDYDSSHRNNLNQSLNSKKRKRNISFVQEKEIRKKSSHLSDKENENNEISKKSKSKHASKQQQKDMTVKGFMANKLY